MNANNNSAIAELQDDATTWRRYLHQHPELEYDVHKTAEFITQKLHSFGVDSIETGISETGIVALIKGRLGEGPTIGFRADMDALPIHEQTNIAWSSKSIGRMHACGHDGHSAMLLGAAKYLSETRNFAGTVALIFQPAEEGAPPGKKQGGEQMVEDGIMEKYSIKEVYSMHNDPNLDIGKFAIRKGAVMAALDEFDLIILGKGGHGGSPHETIDPIVIAAQVILGLQLLVSRKIDPLDSIVLSITKITAGTGYNIIPESVEISGCVRTLKNNLGEYAESQIYAISQKIAEAYGGSIKLNYRRPVPATINHEAQTNLAINVARSIFGNESVDENMKPWMGAEDFSFMLKARPGAFIFLGNGKSAALHHPAYDFNDNALQYGIRYWIKLAEMALHKDVDQPSKTSVS